MEILCWWSDGDFGLIGVVVVVIDTHLFVVVVVVVLVFETMAQRRSGPGEEDVVEYRIFPDLNGLGGSGGDAQTLAVLEEKQDLYLASISRLCADYIWQRDPFVLRPVAAANAAKASGQQGSSEAILETEFFI